MEIKKFNPSQINEVIKLWNESVAPYSIYSPFSEESFKNKFINNPHYDPDGALVAVIDGTIVGFGVATYNHQGKEPHLTPGYIACVGVSKDHWRKKIGTKILLSLEEFLKSKGKTCVRNLFINPINLEWYVPGYDRHEHAGAPAIPFNTAYYFLFMNNGYNVNGQQDAYHIDLTKYTLPEKVINKMKENEANGYTITYYDPNLHYGFDELFDSLQNEDWRRVVSNNLATNNPKPILIVQKDGEILGWTGPVFTTPSGRGSLGGIGVHPKTQGHGLGKSLFCMLCQKSKENDAKFMTLFTGSDNKAREIYLYAGLRLVQSFAVLRKDLK